MLPLAGIVLAYLLGSTPTAYLAGRALGGIDLRQHGSGNLGATNVYRTLGAAAAVAVLLLDAAKGVLPVVWFPRVLHLAGSPGWAIAFGIAAIMGHVRPYGGWFKGGGKGVATAGGVFLGLAPLPFTIALAAFVLVVALTRYVSLGSLVAAAVLPLVMAARDRAPTPLVVVSAALCGFVVWTHRSNIDRLRRGEESRLGRPGGRP
jgi:acyl phosphate:glycerol-3-phosphate acyltransferase